MFQVDEVILYGTTGVCKIQDICEKNFGGVCTRYYILKPLLQETATVFVPTENKKLTRKMHPLLSPEDFQDLFHTISARTPVRPESEEERQQQFESVLQNGDRAGLMMMVHDLHNYRREQQQVGRRLHIADERLLHSAENLLFEEVAFVFGMDKDCAPDFIARQISA